MQARIKDKKEIIPGVLEVDFEVLNSDFSFQAGQYLSIALIDMPYTDDRDNVRYFSICTSPNQKDSFSIITRLSDSAYKRSLARMSLGRIVELGKVSGDLILPEKTDKELVFIAGGIGIAPFMSMLRFAQEKVVEQEFPWKITLLYSNKREEITPFLSELKHYQKKIKNFNLYLTMTNQNDWPGEQQPIDYETIKEQVKEYKNALYRVAGPVGMVMNIANNFDKLGLKPEQYILENFVGY